MLTWLARRTGPGSCARWAAKAFTMLKISNPQLSNLEIFRLMLAARYAVIPDPKAEDFFDNYWLKYSPKIGLYSFVLALIQVEQSWDSTLAIPQSFRDAVLLELANSGLPANVIQPKRLLVVEDSLSLLGTLNRAFRSRNIEVLERTTANDSLVSVWTDDLDGVLCDWVMPGMTGGEFYREVESLKPSLCGRFIFMTGNTPETSLGKSIHEFVRAINAPILYKPFAFEKLFSLVDQVTA